MNTQLLRDFELFSETPMPRMLEEYVLDQYGVDLATQYAGIPIKNPFGKASGQLSNTVRQVMADAEAGLGFCVLKTVIAVNAAGEQSMREWAIPATHMKVEPITGRDGSPGWTVTWIGRGWHDTFEKYLEFFDEALAIGQAADMLVVPSVKYHLPGPDESEWRSDEYEFTTRALLNVWQRHYPGEAMPLEKDFSPTLAGDDRARLKGQILEWIRRVPALIRSMGPIGPIGPMRRAGNADSVRAGQPEVRVGLKLFNALFDDSFQLEMLRAAIEGSAENCPDYLIYGNRLFNPDREFEGKCGVAYGGPDLSARNLKVLQMLRDAHTRGELAGPIPPISATGNIDSGQMACAYERLGCENFQMHTLFQLPESCYRRRIGSRSEKVLHHLLFHPETGYLARTDMVTG